MAQHELKIAPIYYQQVFLGYKNFEIRKNDRDFNAGDRVFLKEFDVDSQVYTGRQLIADIGYVCDYEQKPDYVVFSLLRVHTYTQPELPPLGIYS